MKTDFDVNKTCNFMKSQRVFYQIKFHHESTVYWYKVSCPSFESFWSIIPLGCGIENLKARSMSVD